MRLAVRADREQALKAVRNAFKKKIEKITEVSIRNFKFLLSINEVFVCSGWISWAYPFILC